MSQDMMSTRDRLVYMANQIAQNLAFEGDRAAAATVDHLIQFWDPRMKARIVACAAEPDSGLSATAAQAVALLARDAEAGPKPGLLVESAIEPMGGSDAG